MKCHLERPFGGGQAQSRGLRSPTVQVGLDALSTALKMTPRPDILTRLPDLKYGLQFRFSATSSACP
ncbi:hypothetical protein, partial [Flagellimonas flava]|uniref:hypothetical protein n=1 Tax=Flagellimonas flava TaxID=570519 RepID=UPI003D655BA8